MNDLKQLSALSRNLNLCRRCMLDDVPDGAEIRKMLAHMIETIPEGKRSGSDETNRRLNVCRQCGHLSSGTCELCGCFVEFRAALLYAVCPAIPDKWRA